MADLLGIGAITQGAASLASAPFQMLSDWLNYNYQRKAAEEQNNRQLEWWNMQNEYNSPSAQMERLVKAGLNPNLMYGQMQSSNAGDVGTPVAAQRQWNVNVPAAISDGLRNVISLLQGAESLKGQQLENRKRAAEFVNPDFGISDLEEDIQSYEDYIRFKRRIEMKNLFSKSEANLFLPQIFENRMDSGLLSNVAKKYHNQYLSRTLEDRVMFQRYQQELRARQSYNMLLRNNLQQDINDWYVPNQIINAVYKGIGTLTNFVTPILKLKNLPKFIKTGSF